MQKDEKGFKNPIDTTTNANSSTDYERSHKRKRNSNRSRRNMVSGSHARRISGAAISVFLLQILNFIASDVCHAFSFSSKATIARVGPTKRSTQAKISTLRLQNPVRRAATRLLSSAKGAAGDNKPIVFSAGSSTQPNILLALEEAVDEAVAALPMGTQFVDFAWISVSSLYDGGSANVGGGMSSSTVISAIVNTLKTKHDIELNHLVGSSVAGCISSRASATAASPGRVVETHSCWPVEYEGVPALALTLAVVPDCQFSSFSISNADVIENDSLQEWTRSMSLSSPSNSIDTTKEAVVMLLPSPAFATTLPDLLASFGAHFPQAEIVGGLASTVSSLSSTRLYHYSKRQGTSNDGGGGGGVGPAGSSATNGCVGLILQGDVRAKAFLARGAKPVGGVYQIVKAQDSTIGVIVLDEIATEALQTEEEEESVIEDEEEDEDEAKKEQEMDARARMAAQYAKARIPKPVLAEANFVMRTLSDDDQAFMRRQLLVGLDLGGSVGRTASELIRLAKGEGYRFSVHQVASAGMKDGSVTLPLGSVDVKPGTRLRFFVRDYLFAKKEVEALWMGYKKTLLDELIATSKSSSDDDSQSDGDGDSSNAKSGFAPAACFIIPTLDRGNKFFLGKPGYESGKIIEVMPSLPCITGFFSNGVIGNVEGSAVSSFGSTGIQGSASGYILLGSKSGRPVYSPAAAAAERLAREEQEAVERAEAKLMEAEEAKRERKVKGPAPSSTEKAPRTPDGELILKRREVHSGRALTVSTVEWSVAEKTAQPSSTLEGFMWDKETEVDRFRERVPLANLVSQCRLSVADPTKPKPRDWIGPVKQAALGGFVIVPECKKMEPTTGSLRRRYELSKLVREFTLAGVPAFSVNCDPILFGGSLDDVTKAREAASAAAVEQMSEDGVIVPPVLASDLLLYPYQLYKLHLAGADAVNIVAGALASKDLKYLAKIAQSLKLQILLTVTSEVQIRSLEDTAMDGLIISNRELEDFSFDMTGEQALNLLKSDAVKELREKRGDDFPILVEGRVGIIERPNPVIGGEQSALRYIEELKEAGAIGAIMASSLASGFSDTAEALKTLQEVV